jgi:hypothetical protein
MSFPLKIGEAQIREAAAVEDRNDERAGTAKGELALEQEIRRQLVDGAAGLLRRNQQGAPSGGRRRGIGHLAVATVIDCVVTFGAVSADVGAVCHCGRSNRDRRR